MKNVRLRRLTVLLVVLAAVLCAAPVLAAPKVAVTFDVNGVGEITISGFTYKSYTIEIPAGDAIKSVDSWSVVDQEGHYSFDGWWTDPEYGEKFVAGVPISSDMTFYAHWHTNKIAYSSLNTSWGTVTLDEPSGKYCDGRTAIATAISFPGYKFSRWLDGDGHELTKDNPFSIYCSGGTYRFLVAEFVEDKCAHTNLKYVAGSKPTCTEGGTVEHYECPNCGEYFYDKACVYPAKAEDVYLPKLGHAMTYYAKVNPTCETDGMIEHYECSQCHNCYNDYAGTSFAGTDHQAFILKATGHVWEENGTVTKAPTETEEGEITYRCVNDPSHTKTEPIPKLTGTPTPSPTITPEAVPSTVTPTGGETPTPSEAAPTVTAAPSPGTGSSAENIAPTETPKVINGGGGAQKTSTFRTFMAKYWAIPVLGLIIMILLVLIGVVLGRMRNEK